MQGIDIPKPTSGWERARTGTDQVYRIVNDAVKESTSADNISIDFSRRTELLKLWIPDYSRPNDHSGPPSDIILSRIVPIRDCILTNSNPNAVLDTWSQQFRVMLLNVPIPLNPYIESIKDKKYRDDMQNSELPDRRIYGIILFPIKGYTIMDSSLMGLIFGGKDFETQLYPIMTVCTDRTAEQYYDALTNRGKNIESFVSQAMNGLELWYAVQISLLNPVVKTILPTPRPIGITPTKSNAKKGKHVVKYVKTIRINVDDIKNHMESESKGIHRQTMCWYVIGHWRKTSKGEVFVHPHWKGPMRHLKGKLAEPRDRQIVVKDASGVEKIL